MLKVCIVGYGRAGKIQLSACENILEVKCVVDERASLAHLFEASSASFATEFDRVLSDSTIDVVIVTTPTATHFEICKAALCANKHVFVEKPLASSDREVEELYKLAADRSRLLYTAYNRRHDPEWNEIRSKLRNKKVFALNVICRDYPFPPTSYLETCGGIVRDAAIHDLDMLCLVLDDTPIEVQTTLDSLKESACTNLVFSKGCRANLIHSRQSSYYDQRVMAFTSEGLYEIGRQDVQLGSSFADRYKESYVLQLNDLVTRIKRGDYTPNISNEHACFLERLVDACNTSAIEDKTVMLRPLRSYTAIKHSVRNLYKTARNLQTVEHNKKMREKYAPRQREQSLSIWQVLDILSEFKDISDPDVDIPNCQHALQTAESIRRADLPDWLVLVGLIHDFGKSICFHPCACDEDGTSMQTQWSVVGDTFVVGCALPNELVYSEFNATVDEQFEGLGLYTPNTGLDNVIISYGHDEYLYQVLCASQHNLPSIALDIVRYHSLYAWHDKDSYSNLESEKDVMVKGWVKLFNQHDLYSKRNKHVDRNMIYTYYQSLAQKYLPKGIAF